MSIRTLRQRRRQEDGAVALEAALVTPILLILVFGIIEFSFALRDYVVVVSDSRVGARIASAGAAFGSAVDCTTDDEAVCAPKSVPALAQAAAKAIQTSGSAMPMDNINYILVYEAGDDGLPKYGGTATTCGSKNCVRFQWRKAANEFKYASGSWPAANISACFPGVSGQNPERNLQKVGVYVNTTHKGLTGFFFNQLTITDRAVLNFEPLPVESCGAGQRPA